MGMKKVILLFSAVSFLFVAFTYVDKKKKKECGAKLDSMVKNLSGEWKFVYAEFYPYKGGKELKTYSDHILTFNKNTYSVKKSTDSEAYQTSKIKIKKD